MFRMIIEVDISGDSVQIEEWLSIEFTTGLGSEVE